MQLIQKTRYGMVDFIRIPFRAAPILTGIRIGNRLLNALMPSLQVLVTADFVDTALAIFRGEQLRGAIVQPLLLLMLIVAYSYMNWQLMSFVNLKSGMKLTREYRSAIVEKRAKLEYRHIEDKDTWELVTRASSDPVTRIQEGFSYLLSIADIMIRVISILLILFRQVWWAGLVIIATSLPLFGRAIQGGKATYQANVEVQKYMRCSNYLHSVLQSRENVEERSLYGYTDSVNEKWLEHYETARKIDWKATLKYFVRMKGSSLITVLISLMIIFVLIFPIKDGGLSIGMFISIATSVISLIQMMSWELSNTMSGLARSREYLKDLSSFMALSETEGTLVLPEADGETVESIEFRHVSFRYPGTEKEILKDFNLRMEKNLHYAIVGVNGAGKTTITKLLTGLYDSYEGEIRINGRELREYTQAQRKALFAVVYQDFAKYYIPLADSIALGNIGGLVEVRNASETEIARVAHEAGLDETIQRLPDGVRTWLGRIQENGSDLSGGEWQRVALARCLNHKGGIRILDEPTAALDPVAESNVYEMFGQLNCGVITLFITHRLGAARLADEIVVLEKGRVAEQGSHEQLLLKNGIYAEMFEAQRSWYQQGRE